LQPLGIKIDLQKNKGRGGEREISTDDSRVQILVIPTDEEYMISRDTFDIIQEASAV
jgi:acetate kinase